MDSVLTFLSKILAISVIAVSITFSYQPSTVTLTAPTSFLQAGPWQSLGNYLVNSNYKVYIINWQGQGGSTNIGKPFLRAIQQAQHQGKTIILNLTGNSYSMHALVFCYVNRVINHTNSYAMFHADAVLGVVQTQRQSVINGELNQCRSRGVLTAYDIMEIWSGHEVYKNNGRTWYKKDMR